MAEEIKEIFDISTESLVIGNIVLHPELIDEYSELISSKWDFFNEDLKYLYDLLVQTYLFHGKINETSVCIEVSKMDEESKNRFSRLGSYKAIDRLVSVARGSQEDFKKIYDRLKTYNVLRELRRKSFPVDKYIDKLKDRKVDAILKAYELQLAKIGTYIHNVEDAVRLGDGIVDFYEQLKITPDEGFSVPWPMISQWLRGIRYGTLGGVGLNSGKGKSRFIARMLVHTSIIGQEPCLLQVNEQWIDEWNLMILSATANAVFSKEYGFTVNEDKIARGLCSGKEDEMVRRAAEYIEKNSKIKFYEAQSSYDYRSLKRIMKIHQLKFGIRFCIVDTMKPWRQEKEHTGLSEWQEYTLASELYKKMAKELGMAILFSFQLVDSVLQTGELTSNSISSGKNILHNMDYCILGREITNSEKEKFNIKLQMPDNPFNGDEIEMDTHQDFYLFRLIKNRGGLDGKSVIMKVSRGECVFDEMGWMVKKRE